MTDYDPKATLQRYLQRGRDALVWKLEGLSEYDIRRPLTPTATNLLGIVKHVAMVEAGYLGATFGRPIADMLPGFEDGAELNADMWAAPEQTREEIVGFYRRVWEHSDATIAALGLDAEGQVPWWGDANPVTLHHVLVHMIAENERHAGHADIVRELIDGAAGIRPDNTNLASDDAGWWKSYYARVEQAAATFR